MPTDKYPFYREADIRRGSTFAWGAQLMPALERCRRKFSARGVLLLVLGHSLLPLKEACGLKTQPRLSPFLKHIPWHKWTATCRANRIILPTCSRSRDALHYHRSTLFFFFEGKREPSAVCKPQYHLSLPHKPQIKGLPFSKPQKGPRGPKKQMSSSSLFARHTHVGLCSLCNMW